MLGLKTSASTAVTSPDVHCASCCVVQTERTPALGTVGCWRGMSLPARAAFGSNDAWTTRTPQHWVKLIVTRYAAWFGAVQALN